MTTYTRGCPFVAPTRQTRDNGRVSGASRLESAAWNIVAAARIGDSKLARASVWPRSAGPVLFVGRP